MENFAEWLKINYPRYFTEQQNEQNSQDNLGYRPDEILVQKNVIPKQLIRNAQFDTNKWDKDFNRLQDPSENQNSGFATSVASMLDIRFSKWLDDFRGCYSVNG